MPLTVTVTPGYSFSESELVTYPKLNLLGTPNIFINGTVSTDEIGDSTVTAAKLENNINLAAKLADNSIPLGKLVAGDHGAVLYTDANGDWVALGPGVDGQFLKTKGEGVDPEWANQTGISSVPISMIVSGGANRALTTDASGTVQWETKGKNATGFLDLWEEQASGVSGGNSTAATDVTRVLNQVNDPDGVLASSFSADQFSLPAGDYSIHAIVPGYKVDYFVAWLYNVTDAAIEINGQTSRSSSGDTEIAYSHIVGQFTLAGTKTFEIRWRQSRGSNVTDGLGKPASISGHPEIYTMVRIISRTQ